MYHPRPRNPLYLGQKNRSKVPTVLLQVERSISAPSGTFDFSDMLGRRVTDPRLRR